MSDIVCKNRYGSLIQANFKINRKSCRNNDAIVQTFDLKFDERQAENLHLYAFNVRCRRD